MTPAISVFVDTEFTSLDAPELLSVGLVTLAGDELYLELLDDELLNRASAFAVDTVLPMFGAIPGACASSYLDLATRACDFLLSLGEPVQLISDYRTDRELLEHALRRAPRWPQLEGKLSWKFAPAAAYESDIGSAAMESVWRDELVKGLGRHHALADARALRSACLAVESAGPLRPGSRRPGLAD